MQKYIQVIKICLPPLGYMWLYTIIAAVLVCLYIIPGVGELYGFSDGESGSYAVISTQIETAVRWLSSLGFADFITTFILWAIVGLGLFIILQIILRFTSSIYEDAVFTTKYIHPAGYSTRRHVLFRIVSGLEFVAILVFMVLIFILTVLVFFPETGTYTTAFLFDRTPQLFAGIVLRYILFVLGLGGIHFCYELIRHRNQLLKEDDLTYIQ